MLCAPKGGKKPALCPRSVTMCDDGDGLLDTVTAPENIVTTVADRHAGLSLRLRESDFPPLVTAAVFIKNAVFFLQPSRFDVEP